MSFRLKNYTEPDFSEERFLKAPEAVFVKAEKDGVAPDNFHALSIFPEYFKVDGKWLLAKESRMDAVAVLEKNQIIVKEARRLKKGDLVAVSRSGDLEEGIYLYKDGFGKNESQVDVFSFRTGRSRETSFSREYEELCELLKYEKENGNILWVLGPAFAFDDKARKAFASLVDNGYVSALLAGNALATHDLEAALLHTALGQDIYSGVNTRNGHYNHLEVLNRVRGYGSIKEFIEKEKIDNGIMYALEKNNVPYVLAGSIRDDGPLPEIVGNVYEAQDKMRSYVSKATTVICMASALHSIATGNMTPTYRVLEEGTIREVYFYVVDISEFMANKLADRGSLSSRSIIANVQDFIIKIVQELNIE